MEIYSGNKTKDALKSRFSEGMKTFKTPYTVIYLFFLLMPAGGVQYHEYIVNVLSVWSISR